MRLLVIYFLVLLPSGLLRAQIGQISANPDINPGFAGNMGSTRLFYGGHYSDTKPKRMEPHSLALDNFISVDGYIRKLSSGVGLSYKRTNSLPYKEDNGDKYNSDELKLTIAPKISLKGKWTISPAVSVLLFHHFYSYPSSTGGLNVTRYDNILLNSGLLINNKKGFIGINYLRFTLKRYSWVGTFHMGYNFQKTDDHKFVFSPSILWNLNNLYGSPGYQKIALPNLLLPDNANLNFTYGVFVCGVGVGIWYFRWYDTAYDFIEITPHAILGYQGPDKRLRVLLEGATSKRKAYSNSDRVIGFSVRYSFRK